jgi:hypothetical protein
MPIPTFIDLNMKKPLEEAAQLFRENEAEVSTGDREKANLYRGLALLAEGLRRLEKDMEDLESEIQEGPNRFYNRAGNPIKRRVRAPLPAT